MARYCSIPVNYTAEAYRTQLYIGDRLIEEANLAVGQPAQMWAVFPLPEEGELRINFCDCEEDEAVRLAAMALGAAASSGTKASMRIASPSKAGLEMGENYGGALPCHYEWVKALRDECAADEIQGFYFGRPETIEVFEKRFNK